MFWGFYRHYRGAGPLLNIFLRVYFVVFGVKVRVLIFAHPNRVRAIYLEFLYIVEGSNRGYVCFWSFYRQ